MSEQTKKIKKEDALSALYGSVLVFQEFRNSIFQTCLESYFSEFTNKELEDGITQTFRGKSNGKKIVINYKIENNEQAEG